MDATTTVRITTKKVIRIQWTEAQVMELLEVEARELAAKKLTTEELKIACYEVEHHSNGVNSSATITVENSVSGTVDDEQSAVHPQT